MTFKLISLCLLFSISVKSQCVNNTGKEFYVSFLVSGKLLITSTVNTSGFIANPNTSYSVPFTVSANSFTVIDIPPIESVNTITNTVLAKGFIVTSDDPISLMAFNGGRASSDAALIYPLETLGTEYIVTTWGRAFFTNNFNFPPAALITATENNTELEITPTQELTNNQLPGIPYTIVLNKGETYVVAGKEDISGTIIRVINGNKPVAVFCGQRGVSIPLGFSYADHIFEQINPVSKLGKEFISPVLKSRGKNILKLVSPYNNCVINADGNYLTTLNRGQVFKYETDNTPKYIQSSEPIQLGLFGTSYNYDSLQKNDMGDPTFIIVQPIQQLVKEANFIAGKFDSISIHNICVICPTVNISTAIFDGVNIGNLFTPVPGNTSFSIAAFNITEAKHTIRNPYGFTAYVHGYGFHQAYSYCAGSAVNEIFNPANFSCNGISSADTFTVTVCKGQSIFEVIPQKNNNTFSWDFGDSTSIITTTAATLLQPHDFKDTGNYTVTLTIDNCNGVTEIRKLKIKVYEPAIQFRDADTLIARGSSITLFPITMDGIAQYQWQPDYNISNTHLKNPVVNPLLNTEYTLTITDTAGCTASGKYIVNVFNGLFMPNVFTPNGDGNNDIFRIPEIVHLNLTAFTIYNRWGQVVFNTSDKSKGWDGRFNGKDADAGTYVWSITYLDLLNKKINTTGTFIKVK